MQRRYLGWIGAWSILAALLFLASGVSTGRATPLPKTEAPKPLPKSIITAWTEVEAEIGWLRVDPAFGHLEFVAENEGKPGDLPAFRFARWKEGCLANLPAPSSAFGMSITRTNLTDAGLKELTGLKRLQSLDLYHTKITDAGLRELAELKSLQELDLSGTQVTGTGLKELAGLINLQSLSLSTSQVTSAGLKELAALKRLQALHLGGTKVTDAGLKELASLKSLLSLNLDFTQVTDAGLKELANLKSLLSLSLAETQVTDAGLKELQKALPECRVRR